MSSKLLNWCHIYFISVGHNEMHNTSHVLWWWLWATFKDMYRKSHGFIKDWPYTQNMGYGVRHVIFYSLERKWHCFDHIYVNSCTISFHIYNHWRWDFRFNVDAWLFSIICWQAIGLINTDISQIIFVCIMVLKKLLKLFSSPIIYP